MNHLFKFHRNGLTNLIKGLKNQAYLKNQLNHKCPIHYQSSSNNKFLTELRTRANEISPSLSSLLPPSLMQDPDAKIIYEDTLSESLIKLVKYPVRQTTMKRSAYMYYEQCTDPLDMAEFFEFFKLQDTFFSWFQLTQLHLWMYCSRVMQLGCDGEFLRNQAIEAFWRDFDKRIYIMKINPFKKRKLLIDNYHIFMAGMLAYDEAIVTDDRCLAAALWRIFFMFDCEDPFLMETLIHYVRKQLYILQQLPADQLLYGETNPIKWYPLKSIIEETKAIAKADRYLQ